MYMIQRLMSIVSWLSKFLIWLIYGVRKIFIQYSAINYGGQASIIVYLISTMWNDSNPLLSYRDVFNVCKMFCSSFLNASQQQKTVTVWRKYGVRQNVEPLVLWRSLRVSLKSNIFLIWHSMKLAIMWSTSIQLQLGAKHEAITVYVWERDIQTTDSWGIGCAIIHDADIR